MAGQNAGGIGQYFDGQIDDAGRVLVREVLASTCSHCDHITEYPSRRVMLDYVDICRCCMRLICLECLGKPCNPAEARAERAELEAKLRRDGHFMPAAQQIGWRCY